MLGLGTEWRFVVSLRLSNFKPLLGGKLQYPLKRRLGGPQTGLDVVAKKEVPVIESIRSHCADTQ